MRDPNFDKIKSNSVLIKEFGKTCKIDGCNNPLTHMQGPGEKVLCREHQIIQREYGGMGRIDRPHTFQRDWICDECGTNILEDPRLAAIEDEMVKRRVGRTVMHGDHNIVRKADGGDDSRENVRSLCPICHAIKTILGGDYLNKNTRSSFKCYTVDQVVYS